MNEQQATEVAQAMRGITWNSGGDIWLVIFRRRDGKIVVLSDEVVKVYDSEAAFEEDRSAIDVILH